MASPIIYMIRHGEKPATAADGSDVNGLSAEGLERAQYLPQVFGLGSQYNIGYILAEEPKKDGSRTRPVETVTPLARALGLEINTSISRDDTDAAAAVAKAYAGSGNVLICWEHGQLEQIAKAIGVTGYAATAGVHGKVKYPEDRFDLIWTVVAPYTEISSVTSEDIPGLDDGHANM